MLTGAVDEVVPTEKLGPLAPSLAGANIAVDMHGRGPQSHRVLLAMEPAELVAFANDAVPDTVGSPPWREEEHEVARWCRLLNEHGIDTDPGVLDLPPPERPAPRWTRGATVIHPGAASPARRWPLNRWVTVAAHERRRGRTVLVSGSRADAKLALALAKDAGLPRSAVLAGRTDVLDLAALIAAAGRVLCGDTGVAHLATAMGTPSVVLFGPTSPARWGPPALRPEHRVLWAGMTGDAHGDLVDPGLLRISTDDVLAELRQLDISVGAAPSGEEQRSRIPERRLRA
jgi:ADP-heptose:LPS heptosyltransferase